MFVTRRKLAQLAMAAAPMAAARAEAVDATHRVARFIAETQYADIPREVIELGRKSILDGLGLALAGSVAATGRLAREYLEGLGLAPAGASVIGTRLRFAPRFAAFANGIGIHADDYDDTLLAATPNRVYGLLTHPTAPCLPAGLAIAESSRASGRELMLAYHVGVEVECKIAEAISPRHYEDGFHTTGTCGTFAAAAAAMKLYRGDTGACARALGIAASQSAGLRENFGTMTKPFHAGHAAESGIVAADLARLGWTASDQILEAPRGFFHAAGGGFDPAALRLGKPWTFASPGISIKPFPSGSLTHPAMTALLRLIRQHYIAAAQVARVSVGTSRIMPNALIHHRPTDGLQAKFSMEFCMAVLLLYGRAGLSEFTDAVVRRPEVQALIRRVDFGVNEEAEKAGYSRMTSIVTVHLTDGRAFTAREDFAKGSPANPMSYAEVAAKFEGAARYAGWPPTKVQAIIEGVRKLEDLPDVRTLTALCAITS